MIVVRERARRLVLLRPGVAAVAEENVILRIEAEGLRVVGERALEVALFEIADAAVVVADGILRIEADRLVVVGNRLVVFVLLLSAVAAVTKVHEVAAIQADGLGVVGRPGSQDLRHDCCRRCRDPSACRPRSSACRRRWPRHRRPACPGRRPRRRRSRREPVQRPQAQAVQRRSEFPMVRA